MSYYFSKTIQGSVDEVSDKVKAALKEEGFGVLTEIDIKSTLKEKLGVSFKPYRILGACNPPLAFEALLAEDKIGTMLPCNVVVIDVGEDKTEIAAVDPVASMQAVVNPSLARVADQVRGKLQKVIESV